MSDAEGRVSNILGAVAKGHLRVASKGIVGRIGSEAKAEHVGPLLVHLNEILVVERRVGRAMEGNHLWARTRVACLRSQHTT